MGSGSIPTRTGGSGSRRSVASEVASETDTEPYVYLYAPSFGWPWFDLAVGGGPFFVGPWVHAPRHYSGSYRHYGGYPYYRGPRTVGLAGARSRAAVSRLGGTAAGRPRVPWARATSPRGRPGLCRPALCRPARRRSYLQRCARELRLPGPARTCRPPLPLRGTSLRPPTIAAPVMAPRPDFGGHMGAPPGGHFGGGPHR